MRISSYSNISGWHCVCINDSINIKLGQTIRVSTYKTSHVGKLVKLVFEPQGNHLVTYSLDKRPIMIQTSFKDVIKLEVLDGHR